MKEPGFCQPFEELQASDARAPCLDCAGMLGERGLRGLGLVVHIPSGCVAKINIPCP